MTVNQTNTLDKAMLSRSQSTALIGFVTVTIVLSMQTMRVLVPHLTYNFPLTVMNSSLTGISALLIFSAGLLSPRMVMRLGFSRTVTVCVAGIGVTRLIAQLSHDPALQLVVSAVGMMSFLCVFPLLTSALTHTGRVVVAVGFLTGIALDSGISGVLATWGLEWRSTLWAVGGVAALVIVHQAAAQSLALRQPTQARQVTRFPLWSWGLIVFLNMIYFQNIGLITSAIEAGLAEGFALVMIGNALSIALAVVSLRWPVRSRDRLLVILGIGTALILADFPTGNATVVALWVGQVFLGLLAVRLLGGGSRTTLANPLLALSRSSTVGAISLCALILLYFLAYLIELPIRNTWLPPLVSVIVVARLVWGRDETPTPHDMPDTYALKWSVGLAAGLLLLPVVLWRTTPEIEVMPRGAADTVRVMSYNIHNGFGTSGELSLKTIAAIIKASDADIIGLQEVSRGWFINGSIDTLTWLQRELDMPYAVFAPEADAQWGNALLSRYPITAHDVQPLPLDMSVMQRGFIWASVDLGEHEFPVITTHLHHLVGDEHSQARVREVQKLIDYGDAQPTALIMGDMNAEPDAPEIRAFLDAGWTSAQDRYGLGDAATFEADPLGRVRIDWIFITPELALTDFSIIESTASDHFALVATISLP